MRAACQPALRWLLALLLLGASGLLIAAPKTPQTPSSLASLQQLIESYKPDPQRVAELRARLDAAPPATESTEALATFHLERARAADELGEADRQLADLELAFTAIRAARNDYGNETQSLRLRIQNELAGAHTANGDLQRARELRLDMRGRQAPLGWVISNNSLLARIFQRSGEADLAREAVTRSENAMAQARQNPMLPNWRSLLSQTRAMLLADQGRHEEAEAHFRASIADATAFLAARRAQAGLLRGSELTADEAARGVELRRLQLGFNLLHQRRLEEAELELRETLKLALDRSGRGSSNAANALRGLASIAQERGQRAETLWLARASRDAFLAAGLAPASAPVLRSRKLIADTLATLGREQDALTDYDAIAADLAAHPGREAKDVLRGFARMRSLMAAGRTAEAGALMDDWVADVSTRYGHEHYQTALILGHRAVLRLTTGNLKGAGEDFAAAVPVLTDPGRRAADSMGRSDWARRRYVLNHYVGYLAERGKQLSGDAAAQAVAESFRAAEMARAQGVQKAVALAAARAAATTPELADLMRREQDLAHEVDTTFEALIQIQSRPPDKQLPQVAEAMKARVDAARQERKRALDEVGRLFPRYKDLIDPRAPSLAEARAVLAPEEALVAILSGTQRTYVWVLRQEREPVLHVAELPAARLDALVKTLRQGVDLSNAQDLDHLPAFDLAVARELYDNLLKPAEAAWGDARTLLVVADGALTRLPLSLLVTGPAKDLASAPWLARRVAIATLPSVNALITLRQLPAAAAHRLPFVGFGDPAFGGQASPATPATTRGGKGLLALHVRNAPIRAWEALMDRGDLVAGGPSTGGHLPPLPDTRDEILAMAAALGADPQRDVYLGTAANRNNLAQARPEARRVVAFATHGLVAGDLPGLNQPALALAPSADGKDNGLLLLEDVLRLKLDADWVVLSACNTAAGESASEGLSGLGRGFFYAGARSLLLTHWSVESESAAKLVSGLFERYAQNPAQGRAEALRQAMLALMNGPQRAYAHPAFWAPYVLVGDPGISAPH